MCILPPKNEKLPDPIPEMLLVSAPPLIRVGQSFSLCWKIVVLDKYFARNSVIFDNRISNEMLNFYRKCIPLIGNSSCGNKLLILTRIFNKDVYFLKVMKGNS